MKMIHGAEITTQIQSVIQHEKYHIPDALSNEAHRSYTNKDLMELIAIQYIET